MPNLVLRRASHFAAGLLAVAGLAFTLRAQDVPVEKFTLPNGMTVILHQDRALPIATINIWYSVGAQDEPLGRSGFAHLFEHLMFMGTQRVPGNQFDILMETSGGSNNASTDLHRTDYFSSGPSSMLPTLLWLDADRLEDMGLHMNQDKLDKQRDVVRNELRQVIENAPYAKADELLWPMLFPEGHPYRTGVIGTHQDLEAATVANVMDFFANFYVPNNGSLVVAGDFDPEAIKPLVNDLFGTIPAGAPVPRKYTKPTHPIPHRLTEVKRATAIDKVQLPRVQYTYLSPVGYGPGDAEMRLVGMVLADGKSSRLYKRLVMDEKLAADVGAGQYSYPLGSLFQINVLTLPDADLARVEAIIDEELAKLVASGPTQDELERAQASIEAALLEQMQSLEAKAAMLNEYEAAWGEPNSFKRDLDRYRTASVEAVKDWAGATLTSNARVITRVLPEEPDRAPSARDTRPADIAPTPFSVPAPTTFTLANGVKVLLWTRKEIPLVSMRLMSLPAASLDMPGKEGQYELAAQMLTEGAGELDSLAFEDAIQRLGGSISAGADEERFDVAFSVLKRNLDKGVALFADAITRPRMEATDFERVKDLHIQDLEQADESPTAIAAKIANLMLFGETNPYATSPAGSVTSINSITLKDVKEAYAAAVRPQSSTLLVAGDVTQAELEPLLNDALAAWKGGHTSPVGPGDFSIPLRNNLIVCVVDRPGATQTVIRFQAPSVPFASDQRVAMNLLNTVVGGTFTSRLNQNLREDHGYTYGARSRFAMERSAGSFYAEAQVQAEVTGEAIKEFMNEFARLAKGDLTDDEVAKARETARNMTVEQFSSLDGMLAAAEVRLANGVPLDSIAGDLEKARTINAADLNTLGARIAGTLNEGVLVLVGDQSVILPQLAKLTLPEPILFLDENGRSPVADTNDE